jgi:Protein of unknown function (DUF4058)
MPVHDWSRVSAGIFHAFHLSWVVEIKKALNTGLLPSDFYAQIEQTSGEFGPEVTAIETASTRFTSSMEEDECAKKQNRIAIRNSAEDRLVALIEIISPGNKNSRPALRSFVNKVVSALVQRHLLLVDLHPPGLCDPQGIHGAIWLEIDGSKYEAPANKPLTLAAYEVGSATTAYIEPIAVGDVLPDMPLFLAPGVYVPVPLEATYQEAWRGMPPQWRAVLEA